jgi:hypothetical protein
MTRGREMAGDDKHGRMSRYGGAEGRGGRGASDDRLSWRSERECGSSGLVKLTVAEDEKLLPTSLRGSGGKQILILDKGHQLGGVLT